MKNFYVGLCILLFSTCFVRASDIMGADMTYRCIGQDSFEFTTIVYKDCNANWSIPANTYNLHISAINCSFTAFTVYPTLVSCEDITPICGTGCTKCISNCNASSSNSGCSFPYGIEKLTFKSIVYLGNTSCCNFHIGYIGNSTRNYATTTCCNTDLFYTHVDMNRCATPCNSSPTFSNDPIGILCAGQDFVFNNGAMDTTDGDSLSFELAPALRSNGQSASYYSNFSATRPLTFQGFPNQNLPLPAGFHLDPQTGDMAFRPTTANQIAVIVIKVKEWRMVNGVMTVISESRRDMQVMVINCQNSPPEIDPPFSRQACAGEEVCLSIDTDDANTNDTVRISWNAGISGATFTHNNGTVKHASGEVCWTPTDYHVSNIPYTFTITATDDACPLKGQSIRAFSIYVRESPKADINHQLLGCGKVAVSFTPHKQYPGMISSWLIRDPNNKGVHSSVNKQYDTVFLQPGLHRVFLTLRTPTPCIRQIIDTIIVPEFVTVTLPNDTVLCGDASLNLVSKTMYGDAPYTYQWYDATDLNNLLAMGNNPNMTVNPDSFGRYVIEIHDDNPCFNYDTILVYESPLPKPLLDSERYICKDESTQIDGGNDSISYKYLWSNGDTGRFINVQNKGNFWVRITDSLGCQGLDTVSVFVNTIKPNAGPDLNKCKGDTFSLYAQGADSCQWYDLTAYTVNPTSPPLSSSNKLFITATLTKDYILKGTKTENGISCTELDTVRITVHEPSLITFNNGNIYCPDEKEVLLNNLLQFPTLPNGSWRSDINPTFVSGNKFFPSTAGPSSGAGHPVIYSVTDNHGCLSEKSTFIKVAVPPKVVLTDTASLCGNAGTIKLNNYKSQPGALFIYSFNWSSANGNALLNENILKSTPHSASDPGLNVDNLLQDTTYPLTLKVTDNLTGCANADTLRLRIKEVPATEAGSLTAVCWDSSPIDLNVTAAPAPAGGNWSSVYPVNSGNFDPISTGYAKKYTGETVKFIYTVNKEGCIKSDSLNLVIKPQPAIQLQTPVLCITEGDVSLNDYAVVNPAGGSFNWSGPGVTGTNFNTVNAGGGIHQISLEYTAGNGCINDTLTIFTVQEEPLIEAHTKLSACAGDSFPVSAQITNAAGILWESSGDGTFTGGNSTSNNVQTVYYPGNADLAAKNFTIKAATTGSPACAEASESYNILIYPVPDINIEAAPLEGCAPLEVQLKAATDAPSGSEINWLYGNGSSAKGRDELLQTSYIYKKHGTYPISLYVITDQVNGSCRKDATPVYINVFPKPVAAMDANKWKTSIASPGVQFYDRSAVAGDAQINSWLWNFDDANQNISELQHPYFEYPVENPNDTGTYLVKLKVTTNNLCWDTTSRPFHLKGDISVFIPNAFTPNNNGVERNNRFYVVVDGHETFEITIFDRWGEDLYYSTNPEEGWDGKYKGVEVPDGVYVYLVRVTSLAKKEYAYYGTITLLR